MAKNEGGCIVTGMGCSIYWNLRLCLKGGYKKVFSHPFSGFYSGVKRQMNDRWLSEARKAAVSGSYMLFRLYRGEEEGIIN